MWSYLAAREVRIVLPEQNKQNPEVDSITKRRRERMDIGGS